MKNILFTGAVFDSSGYAEASRNYIGALSTVADINLEVRAVSFDHFKTEHPQYEDLLKKYMGKQIKPDVQIVHLTPENYARSKLPGIKNIGMTVWETSRLPSAWVAHCNEMDEIWVPCDWNVQVFKESGVVKPVHKVPHTIEMNSLVPMSHHELGIPTDRFKFYSVFQWSERKNPEGLIRAFCSEFSSKDNVALVLKTYLTNDSAQDKEAVKNNILSIKKEMFATDTAPIILVHGALSRDQMLDLHQQCDAFVLPHRAEGWGVPHFEAMAQGKTVIATGFGGNLEFMTNENSYITGFSMTPVTRMGRPTYHGRMEWAEPNLGELKYVMRSVFEEGPSQKFAEKAKARVAEFSWENVGKTMKEYL